MDTSKITSIIAELEYGDLAAQIISNHSVDGYCLVDENFRILWSNLSFNQIFGYTEDEVNQFHIDTILRDNPLKKKEYIDLIQKKIKLTDLSGQVIHKSGRRFFSSINITIVEYENNKYYLYSFPLYSKRVKKIIEMMRNSFSFFVKEKHFFLAEIDINHPYNIRLITRECYNLLNKDFSEMQSKSILLFLEEESRSLISDVLENLVTGNDHHCIITLDWKKNNKKIAKTKTIIQANKSEDSFILLVMPIIFESDSSTADEDSNSEISSTPSVSEQLTTCFQQKKFDFLESSINELEAQAREIEKEMAKMETEIEWLKKTWEDPEGNSNSFLVFEEKIFTFLDRYRFFLIPGMVLLLVVTLGIVSVQYPENPYVKKIENIMLTILHKK